MTMALILLTLPLERALRGDPERVGFTVAAAALVVGISAVVHRVGRPAA